QLHCTFFTPLVVAQRLVGQVIGFAEDPQLPSYFVGSIGIEEKLLVVVSIIEISFIDFIQISRSIVCRYAGRELVVFPGYRTIQHVRRRAWKTYTRSFIAVFTGNTFRYRVGVSIIGIDAETL